MDPQQSLYFVSFFVVKIPFKSALQCVKEKLFNCLS